MADIELKDIAKRDGYQKYRSAAAKTADYTATYEDRQLIVVADGAGVIVTVTLPLKADFPGGVTSAYSQVLEIVCISQNGGKVKIKSGGTDKFDYGNTEFIIPANSRFIELGLAFHGHFLRRELTADFKLGISVWTAIDGIFDNTYKPLKWDTVIHDSQPDFFSYNSGTGKITVLTTGYYDITTLLPLDSTGGGTYNVWAQLYKNGNIVLGSELRTGNYSGEDNQITGVGWGLHLDAADTLELKVRESAFTGSIINPTCAIRLKVG